MSLDRDELLARIVERGEAIRRRRAQIVSSVAACALLVGVAVTTTVLTDDDIGPASILAADGTTSIVLAPGDGGGSTPGVDDDSDEDRPRRPDRSERSERPTPTRPDRGEVESRDQTSSGSTSTTTTTLANETLSGPSSSTSTSLVCRNSTNPDCGEFSYDPPLPPNRPAKITITASPASPKVGEQVTFTVRIDDPDGSGLGCESFDADVAGVEAPGLDGADPHPKETRCIAASVVARYGPWDPPPDAAPRERTFTATYTATGSRTVVYETEEAGQCEDGSCPPQTKRLTLTVQP